VTGHILVYDADCGLCTRFRNTVELLDAHGNLTFISIDHAEQVGLLDELPDHLRHRSFHLILPDKKIESGAKALPTLIGLLPTGGLVSRLITNAPKGKILLGFLYSMVSRRHEAGLCKLPNASAGLSGELNQISKKTKARAAAHLTMV